MDNPIQTFRNPSFGQIRTLTIKEEPWFVGKDVAIALGYAKPENALAAHVDEEDKTITLIQGSGSNYKSNTTLVNESGLYSLIFASKLSMAKQFKHWVTSEVLPAIRKTGGYMTVKDNESDEDLMARAMLVAQATLKRREERIKALESDNAKKNKELAEQAPKVTFADAIVGSKSSCLIGELAKILRQNGINVGQNRLFSWLRDHKFLGNRGEYYNIPNQQYIDQKLFELKKTTHSEGDHMITRTTTKVTGKGQLYFINGFKSGRFAI